MHNQVRLAAVLALFVALFAGSLSADEGRIPLYEQTTITMPGSYIVTRNISAAAGPVLTIVAEGVTVDLNGFEINGMDCSRLAAHDVGAVRRNGEIGNRV